MIDTQVLTKSEWDKWAEDAHLIAFSEIRPAHMNRYDYAIVTQYALEPLGYITVRELDSESVYIPYGGAFPSAKGTKRSFDSFGHMLEKLSSAGIKNIMFYVNNKNLKMINFAHGYDFFINGCRMFEGEVFVEFLRRR